MGWDAVWWMGDAWYDALGCSVMNGWCIVWCSVWWMGDAWVMHEWCDVNEWMNERMNEWMNEWWINECVGYVEWPCAFCCILTVFVICLCIFSGLFLLTNKHHIHPRTSVCRSRTNPTCNIGAQWVRLWVFDSSLVVIGWDMADDVIAMGTLGYGSGTFIECNGRKL